MKARSELRGRQTLAADKELAAQWHPTKNGDLRPGDVALFSRVRVWWRCPKGPDHEWHTTVANRSTGKGCPFCSNRMVSASGSLAALRPDLAAEWHKTKATSRTPHNVAPNSNIEVWWHCPRRRDHYWLARVAKRAGPEGAGCPLCAGPSVAPALSLEQKRPDVAALWHTARNGALRPAHVTPNSPAVVWWHCPKAPGHLWRATVASCAKGGCPFCERGKAFSARSLAATHKRIAAEWHPDKNGDLGPGDVLPGSHERVWWRCARDPTHTWEAIVSHRTRLGASCPYCRGRLFRRDGEGSLLGKAPEVARQWHPTKNGTLGPGDVSAKSRLRIWWACPAGPDHEWQATPSHRAELGRGCPFCVGRRVSITNALSTVRPDLAASWHPTRNGTLTPRDVTVGSHTVVVWRCPTHPRQVWSTTVHSRPLMGCRLCRVERRRLSATNCFAAQHPRLAAEWHPTRNGKLKPDQVFSMSSHEVFWQCKAGHAWQARVSLRVREQSGCPACRLAGGRAEPPAPASSNERR